MYASQNCKKWMNKKNPRRIKISTVWWVNLFSFCICWRVCSTFREIKVGNEMKKISKSMVELLPNWWVLTCSFCRSLHKNQTGKKRNNVHSLNEIDKRYHFFFSNFKWASIATKDIWYATYLVLFNLNNEKKPFPFVCSVSLNYPFAAKFFNKVDVWIILKLHKYI